MFKLTFITGWCYIKKICVGHTRCSFIYVSHDQISYRLTDFKPNLSLTFPRHAPLYDKKQNSKQMELQVTIPAKRAVN